MPDILVPLPAVSSRQGEALLVVAHTYAMRRQSPSAGEIRAAMGLGPKTSIEPYIRPLIDKGYLETGPKYARRGFKLTPLAMELLPVLMREHQQPISEVEELIHKFHQQAE